MNNKGGQQVLPFIVQAVEDHLDELKELQEAIEELPAGTQRYQNQIKLDRAKDLLIETESNYYRNYSVERQMSLIRSLIEQVWKNLR
jgi:hypothetical protein